MILAPYKEAGNRYQRAVNRLFSRQSRRWVPVRSVDTAQGQEADVVFGRIDSLSRESRAGPWTPRKGRKPMSSQDASMSCLDSRQRVPVRAVDAAQGREADIAVGRRVEERT